MPKRAFFKEFHFLSPPIISRFKIVTKAVVTDVPRFVYFFVHTPVYQGFVKSIESSQNSKDSLVVIKEFRVPLNDYEWGLPAGLIDPGEDIKNCVKRELKEETGLELVSFLREPSPIVYNSAGITNEGCSIVFVEATGTISKEHLQDEEDIETYLMSKLDVKTLMWLASNGKTKIGAKAWMAFELFLSGVI